MKTFLKLIETLESGNIHYTLAVNTPEALMVTVSLPGRICEVEFSQDGKIECETFVSSGEIDCLEFGQLIERLGGSTPILE